MTFWKIVSTKRFEKDFRKLPKPAQKEVIRGLEELGKDPFFNTKKLEVAKIGRFSKKVGNYRIRFDIFKNEIALFRVRDHKEIYRDIG